jgi:hypothetical protein
MNAQDHAALDALVAQARAAQPPALTPLEARRSARLAVAAAERARAQKRRLAWLCAACLALGLTVLATHQLTTHGTTIEVAAGGRPLRVALRTGDTLLASPGARLEVLAQEAAQRALRLTAGAALFDVKHLERAQRFEVFTRQAHVSVLGTVFSVEVEHGRTVVRVYEGRVWVAERSLSAGEVWTSSGPAAALDDDPLAAEGRAAAALRLPAPSPIVSSLPDVTTSAARGAADAGASGHAALIIVSASGPGWVAPAPAPAAPLPVPLEEARRWLLAGDSERALGAAQSVASTVGSRADEPRAATDPAWLLLEADALRALRRYAEAVERYQALAERVPAQRALAGYAGASLAFYELHDATRALALLDVLALDEASSPLRERASVLRVEVLLALGQHDQAKLAAQRYLEREPETQVSRRMRALLR